MSGLAVLFPGQGAQRPGMGDGLWESDPELLDAHLARAERHSGLPIGRLVAGGSAAALARTDVAQSALYAVCLALFDVARELGLRPVAVGGHSLGEYTGTVAAGALGVEDGAALVAARGALMADAQRRRPGAMAAILGPAAAEVRTLCERAAGDDVLDLANLNTPTQTVVSGDAGAVDRLLELIERRPRMRGVRLPAGAAFHSRLLRPVGDELAGVIAGLPWRDPDLPVASNAAGALVRDAAGVRESLMAQVASPVRWVDCVRALLDAGCEHFLELGPGGVLRGLVRQISRRIDVATADSRAAIEAYAASRPHLLSPGG